MTVATPSAVSGFRPFEGMREIEGRRWTLPEGVTGYVAESGSITARKP